MISDDPIIVSIMEQKCELLQKYSIEDCWMWFGGAYAPPLIAPLGAFMGCGRKWYAICVGWGFCVPLWFKHVID